MSRAEARFWRRDDEKYHELEERFERNIERVHPGAVSSDRMCPWCYHCTWAKTAVVYYEHRGPKV